ncbi:hypothetical protein Vadar_019525 [Vaccinium darrowii]|uniref:Uncharacterized protein n=1 Tax=Vaccinium darrowii TaxID=229202 RepID=A0ACB7YWL8_9ERIC|nr:hypothetical protein Vadar_019525 [Vaccinium darrowii]
MKRRWSRCISQYNLIFYCLHPGFKKWEKLISNLGLINILDSRKYVTTERFNEGQLYVGLCRATTAAKIEVILDSPDITSPLPQYTKDIVYHEILNEAQSDNMAIDEDTPMEALRDLWFAAFPDVALREDEEAFNVLYCLAFAMMDAQWLAMRASCLSPLVEQVLALWWEENISYLNDRACHIRAKSKFLRCSVQLISTFSIADVLFSCGGNEELISGHLVLMLYREKRMSENASSGATSIRVKTTP